MALFPKLSTDMAIQCAYVNKSIIYITTRKQKAP